MNNLSESEQYLSFNNNNNWNYENLNSSNQAFEYAVTTMDNSSNSQQYTDAQHVQTDELSNSFRSWNQEYTSDSNPSVSNSLYFQQYTSTPGYFTAADSQHQSIENTGQINAQLDILNSIDYFSLGDKSELVLRDNYMGSDAHFGFNPTNSQSQQPFYMSSLGDAPDLSSSCFTSTKERRLNNENISSHQAKLEKKIAAYEKRVARQMEKERKKALRELNRSKNVPPVSYNLDLSVFNKTGGGKLSKKRKDDSLVTAGCSGRLDQSSSNCSLANDLVEFATLNHFGNGKASSFCSSKAVSKKSKKSETLPEIYKSNHLKSENQDLALNGHNVYGSENPRADEYTHQS
jgi:hypothetical protein